MKCKIEFGINDYNNPEIINTTEISLEELIILKNYIDRVLDTVISFRKSKEKNNKLKIEIEWYKLEAIAKYYQFPVAVFFAPQKIFKGTRENQLLKKVMKLEEKLKEFLGD